MTPQTLELIQELSGRLVPKQPDALIEVSKDDRADKAALTRLLDSDDFIRFLAWKCRQAQVRIRAADATKSDEKVLRGLMTEWNFAGDIGMHMMEFIGRVEQAEREEAAQNDAIEHGRRESQREKKD